MAIAYDSSARATFAVTTSQTLAHTCTGTNLILFANIGTVGATDLVTGVTYNGVAMTRLQTDYFATVGVRVYQYYLTNPQAGTHNIVVSLTSGNVATESISYRGASQAAPNIFAAQQTGTASSWSQSLTTTADNSWVMAYITDSIGRTPVVGANTTLRQTIGQGDSLIDSGGPKTPAGSATLNISSWTAPSSPAVNSLMVVIAPSVIDFDSQATSSGGAVSSLTYAHTCSGANRLIMVGVFLVDSNARTITSVTYAGTAMTALYNYAPGTVGSRWVAMYYLLAPSTGTNNVVVTLSGAVSNNIVSSSLSYTGVKQTGFPDANNKADSASTTSLSVAVTTVADNSWLAGFAWLNDATVPTGGTGTTKRTSSTYGNGFMDGYDSNSATTPAGSDSLVVNVAAATPTSLMVASFAPAGITVASTGNFFLVL